MASQYALISKSNFSTTPYHYQSTSGFARRTTYYFYKSNVCWDVYIRGYNNAWVSFYFYDYDNNIWVPYASESVHIADGDFQYATGSNGTLRFFHNCLTNYNNSAYTANTKLKDKTFTYNGRTYDSRGFSLWRIRVHYWIQSSNNDFNINSYGPGYLTDSEYNAVCKGKKIYCGGKGNPNSDDQHITTSSADSQWNQYFLPSLFSGQNKLITADLDRQCIPDWKWAIS